MKAKRWDMNDIADQKGRVAIVNGPSGFKEIKGYPKKVSSVPWSHDRTIGQKLWAVSEELTGIIYP